MAAEDMSLAPSGAHTVGSRVWVADSVQGWVKGQVTNVGPQGITVQLASCESRTLQADDLPLQNPDTNGVEDMTTLAYLNEPGVLWNLNVRYNLDDIYTYTGSILIAVNPFASLPHLYGPHMMEAYRGAPLGELSPHVYAVADAAYRQMRAEHKSQSILVSGESGAGKTETSKLIMQYLAWMGGFNAETAALNAVGGRSIEQQVLESNPLLEAFGNAKTSRNNNSSRFGKFTEIQFGKDGRITGAAIRTYLLERSRVVSVGSPERNYHVFYQLCAGADAEEAARLRLRPAREFHYLDQSDCFELDGVDNAEEYRRTRRAMTVVGLDPPTQDGVFAVVAAVLHLGNVAFEPGSADDDAARVASGAEPHLSAAAALLGVDAAALARALTTRLRRTPEGDIASPLDVDAATENRDALAKTVYARLFDWLVEAVNESIGQDAGATSVIGVLDIYGFESFAVNDLEQFCINLANEKLQQHFNAHVFKHEQAEYEREGIAWSYIDFVDNQDVLDLIEGRLGILDLLDETCRFPKATHEDLANKLYAAPGVTGSARFSKPKLSRTDFTVAHYAGAVTYRTDNFLAKNRDFVVAEHQALLGGSSEGLVRVLFAPSESSEPGAHPGATNGRAGAPASAYRFASVGSRFKRQLADLMIALRSMEPHYVRCIKPNAACVPARFEAADVLHQLRCGGVLEAVRISCAGYPTRLTYAAFADHFWPLAAGDDAGTLSDEDLARLVAGRALEAEGVQFGGTKVFLRAGRMARLDRMRTDALAAAATRIQASVRRWAARRRFLSARAACVVIQSAWRGAAARKLARALRADRAAVVLQAATRRWAAVRRLAAARAAATAIQSAWRGVCARRTARDLRAERAATTIQARWRGARDRRAFLALRAGAIAAQGRWRVRVARRELRARRAAARDAGRLLQDKAALETKLAELARVLEAVKGQRNELRAALREERSARESAEHAAAAGAAAAAGVAAAAAEGLRGELAAAQEATRVAQAAAESLREELTAARQAAQALQASQATSQEELTAKLRAAEAGRADAEQRGAASTADLMSRLNNALAQRNAAREEALMVEARLKAVLEDERRNAGVATTAVNAATPGPVLATALTTTPGGAALAGTPGATPAAEELSMFDRVRRYMSSPGREVAGTPATPRGEADSGPLSEMDRRQRELFLKQQALMREQRSADQDRLLGCLAQPLGYHRGRPVAAVLVFRCCLQWKTFQADRTPLFDRVIQVMGAAVEAAQEDNAVLAYWLTNTATLLYLLQRNIKPASGGTYAARLRSQGQTVTRGLFGGSGKPGASGALSSLFARAGYGSPAGAGEASIHGGAAGGLRQVEAKYPALLFKQQLDAFVQKIFPSLRDNIKREVMPHLAACIHAPRAAGARGGRAGRPGPAAASAPTSDGPQGRTAGGVGRTSSAEAGVSPWSAVLGVLEAALCTLREHHVPAFLVRRLFEQLFSFINVQLFNQLLLRRECCSFSNGEYVKTGLAEVELWAGGAGRAWVGEGWEALAHIRQAVTFLVIHQKHKKTLSEITTDLCPVLTVQQLYRISTMYWDDRYGTETVSHDVLARMKAAMVDGTASAASHSFLLDEDSALPFTQDDIVTYMDDKDLLGEMTIPSPLKDHPSFAFLNKRLELALQSAAVQ